jgi:hypothetical protein
MKRAVATLLQLVCPLFLSPSGVTHERDALVPDPDICVLRPHTHGPLAPPVLKAVKNYLLRTFEVSEHEVSGCIPDEVSHWGKISFTGGGDKIHAAELFMYSEKNMTCDASFIKVCLYFHLYPKLMIPVFTFCGCEPQSPSQTRPPSTTGGLWSTPTRH